MLIAAYLGKLNAAFHMVTVTSRRYVLALCLMVRIVGSECSLVSRGLLCV